MSCIPRVRAPTNAPGFLEPTRLTAAACTLASFEHVTWTLVYPSTVRAQTTAEDFHFLPLPLVPISQSISKQRDAMDPVLAADEHSRDLSLGQR